MLNETRIPERVKKAIERCKELRGSLAGGLYIEEIGVSSDNTELKTIGTSGADEVLHGYLWQRESMSKVNSQSDHPTMIAYSTDCPLCPEIVQKAVATARSIAISIGKTPVLRRVKCNHDISIEAAEKFLDGLTVVEPEIENKEPKRQISMEIMNTSLNNNQVF